MEILLLLETRLVLNILSACNIETFSVYSVCTLQKTFTPYFVQTVCSDLLLHCLKCRFRRHNATNGVVRGKLVLGGLDTQIVLEVLPGM